MKQFNNNNQKKKSSKQRASHQLINKAFGTQWNVSFPPDLVGFPDRLRLTLKYSESIALSGSATPAAQVFTVNSLFKPNLTSAGHQPSYYDTITNLYNRYCVLGCSAMIEVVNEGTVPFYIVAVLSDIDLSAQSIQTFAESKLSVQLAIGSNAGVGKGVINIPYTPMSRIQGQRIIEPDAAMYASTVASPSDGAFMYIKAAATDGSSTISARIKVTILFDSVVKDLDPQFPS